MQDEQTPTEETLTDLSEAAAEPVEDSQDLNAAPEGEAAEEVATDEAQAARSRARVFAELAGDGSLVAVSHFSFPGLGHLRRSGKGWAWVPLDYSSQVR